MCWSMRRRASARSDGFGGGAGCSSEIMAGSSGYDPVSNTSAAVGTS